MIEISSLTNEKVKYWVRLNKKKYRDVENVFLVESEHLVLEALNLGIVEAVITTEDLDYEVQTYKVTEEIMKKISNLECAPKVMAVVKKKESSAINGNVLLLDRIQDPGNLGTMIRSAVAFNVKTIVLSPGCVDPYNSKVIRASEGMFFKINIVMGNLEEIIANLKQKNYVIYGTKVTGGTNVKLVSGSKNYGLVIGNEGQGVSEELLNICDEYLYIKMNEECESLNAAMAASIIMHQLDR